MRAPRNWSPWVYSAGIGTPSRIRPAPASEWHNVRVAYCVRVGECGIEHLAERSTIPHLRPPLGPAHQPRAAHQRPAHLARTRRPTHRTRTEAATFSTSRHFAATYPEAVKIAGADQ